MELAAGGEGGGVGVEDEPVGRGHPVSEDVETGCADGHVHAGVIMAEDEVVHGVMGLEAGAVLIEGLVLSAERIGDGLLRAGTVAPAGSPLEGNPGMN